MVAVFDVIRVAARHRYDTTDDQVNVLHFSVHTVPTPNTDANVMADLGALLSNVYTSVQAHIADEVKAIDLSFYNLTQDAPIGQITWPGSYDGGTATGEPLPTHDTALLLMKTSVKRTQGRIFLPTFTEAAQNGSNWTAAVHTAVDAMASMLLIEQVGEEAGGEYQYGIYKRSTGAMVFPTSAILSDIVAVQKRRKRGRGS